MGEKWKPEQHDWFFTPEFYDGELVMEGFHCDELLDEEPPIDEDWGGY